MPKGSHVSNSGKNVYVQHLSTPCGRVFSGEKNMVMKLFKMHTKVCDRCSHLDYDRDQIKLPSMVSNLQLPNECRKVIHALTDANVMQNVQSINIIKGLIGFNSDTDLSIHIATT